MIALLGEGPLNGIVREDDQIWTTTGIQFPRDNPPLVYLDNKLWTEYSGVQIWFYDGASDQELCNHLASNDTAFDQYMRHTAYLYIGMVYNTDVQEFSGMPDITVTYSGLKIDNPISGETEWSNNAALCTYDFMSRPSTRGGMGLPDSVFHKHSLADAIDYCDTMGWTANFPITDNNYAADNLELLLACWRGAIVQSVSQFKFLYYDLRYESTVMTLTDADIVDNTLHIEQPDEPLPNAIRIKYHDEIDRYVLKDYVYTDTTALANDGDRREIEVKLYGLTRRAKFLSMGYYLLERARNNRVVSFTGSRRTIALEPMDIITLTHEMPGWAGVPLRVVSSDPDMNTMTNRISAVMESNYFYNSSYQDVIEDLWLTSLPSPTDPVPSVTEVNLVPETYTFRGKAMTRLIVEFDPPDESEYPWWDGAQVFVKIDDGGWLNKTRVYSDYVIDPVQEGSTYYIKLRSWNEWGRRQPMEGLAVYKKFIVGAIDVPSDLDSMTATAAGDAVAIYADSIEDADVAYYEIRFGDTWDSAIFMSASLRPSLRLTGVRPGTHKFWMSPVRLTTSGNPIYSDNPVYAQVTVYRPPGYATAGSSPPEATQSWDYEGIGTHDNTEHNLIDTTSYLICSHNAGVLTGTWTSPAWDLSSAKIVRVWGRFYHQSNFQRHNIRRCGRDGIILRRLGRIDKIVCGDISTHGGGAVERHLEA
jgi:hypothetical protein